MPECVIMALEGHAFKVVMWTYTPVEIPNEFDYDIVGAGFGITFNPDVKWKAS